MEHTTLTRVIMMTALMVGLVLAQDLTHDQKNLLDRTVSEVMRCASIPSLSLTLVSLDNRVRHTKGYGRHDSGQKSVNEKSVFCIGGATQAFTGVLLAKLLEGNENFTWNTPVQDIVGHRLALPDNYLSNNLNLKDILAMRSGLAGMDIIPVAKPFSVEKLISNLRYAPRVESFREKFVYNEVLFSLLEEVVKVLGGDTWRNLIRRHILEPLDMQSTVFVAPKPASNENFVKGLVYYGTNTYSMDPESYSGLELVAPASSLCTTADDMSKWLRFLLTGGQVGNGVLVRKETLEATYEAIQPRGRDEDPVIQGYRQPVIQVSYSRDHNSLGWINGYYRGYPFVSQDGSLPGYQALATVIPSSKVAAFVAFNGDQDEKRFLAKVMLNILGIDLLIQGNPWFRPDEVCSIIDNISKVSSKNRKEGHIHRALSAIRPLEDYAGIFKNYAYGEVHVKFNASGDSSLTLEYGKAVYKLEPTNKNNTFQLIAQSGDLWYSTNTNWFREYQRIFAEFFHDSHDPEQRISTVSIDGFDKHYTPQFSKNARPPQYDEFDDNQRCSASVLMVWQWSIFLFSTLMCFR